MIFCARMQRPGFCPGARTSGIAMMPLYEIHRLESVATRLSSLQSAPSAADCNPTSDLVLDPNAEREHRGGRDRKASTDEQAVRERMRAVHDHTRDDGRG